MCRGPVGPGSHGRPLEAWPAGEKNGEVEAGRPTQAPARETFSFPCTSVNTPSPKRGETILSKNFQMCRILIFYDALSLLLLI